MEIKKTLLMPKTNFEMRGNLPSKEPAIREKWEKEQEELEKERLEKERIEKERLEKERIERERLMGEIAKLKRILNGNDEKSNP